MHYVNDWKRIQSISGLVAEYIVAIDVTRVRFPADAFLFSLLRFSLNSVASSIRIFFDNMWSVSGTRGNVCQKR